MQAVVLAAGKGIRLRPLTEKMPKAMVELNGKPMIERVLGNLSKAGFLEAHIIVGYMKEAIEKKIGEKFAGMTINYFVQEKQLGTAHALSLVEEFVDEKFLAINGDVLVEPELLKELIEAGKKGPDDAVIVCRDVEDPWDFGCLKLEKNKVVDIVEKPPPGQEPSKTVNIGVYVFDKKIFEAIREIDLSERNEFELVDAIKKLIADGKTVTAKKYAGFYAHIGNEKDIMQAEKKLKN